MPKIPFKIVAVKKGKIANIDIIGEIGWEVNSNQFRAVVRDLVNDGCTEAFLYINSPGGSCFDANEIANILLDNFKKIKGEGGALVASAAAYLAQICEDFSMPSNGQFMTHRPSGWVGGTVIDIESYLKMIKDIDKDYYESFLAKAKDKEDFQKKWESGSDNWMNAKEAMDAGFITSVREKVKIDKDAEDMIKAVMSVNASTKPYLAHFLTNHTEMKEVAKLLNLKDDATEAECVGAINPIIVENSSLKSELQKEKDEKKVLKDKLDAIELAEKNAKAAKAKAAIEEAIKDGRIDDDEKHTSTAFWTKNFENDFDGTTAQLAKLPKRKDVKSHLKDSSSTGESAWEKRQAEINAKKK